MPMARRPLAYPPWGEPCARGFTGEAPRTWDVRIAIDDAIALEEHVPVDGETGTGKELCANAIRDAFTGADKPFIAVNCANLDRGLADSLLFGNLKNYPNPPQDARDGVVGTADGGCLFLDELGELTREVQTKLLRFLQFGEYTRLGESKARRAKVLVIAATNHPENVIPELLERFGARIHVPSLAERREDIALLVRRILIDLAASGKPIAADARRFLYEKDGRTEIRIEASLMIALVRASYPRNIRQLEKW
jgi:two-component system nitrogen regulation response regulator GlnG/two-component system response regulator HydG